MNTFIYLIAGTAAIAASASGDYFAAVALGLIALEKLTK